MAQNSKVLNIYYQNVRGLRTKSNIRSTISASGYDMIVFTEHWLNDNFESSEYFDDSYFVEREDRNVTNKQWGGGALIAIKNHISYTRCLDWERESPFDNLWLELKSKSNSQKMFINVVYIPPRTKFEQYEKYCDILTEIMCARESNANFFIFGDFNFGAAIEWFPYMNECLPLSYDGNIASEFINTLAITELKQLNYIRNVNNRILDLMLTNCDTDTLMLTPATEITKIDAHHPPFEMKITAKDIKFITPIKTPKLNYFKANYELINYEISRVNWISELNVLNINEQLNRFYTIVGDIIHRFTPVLLPKDDKYPKWFSKKLIELINDKNYFHDKYKQTNIECFNDLYKKNRREIKYEMRACENKYTESIEETIKTNTKAFFAYTKSLNKSNKLPNIMNLKDESSDNPSEIANLFAKHFESVYEPINNNSPVHDFNCNCDEHFEISTEQISNVINGMSENKTNSPDNIPMVFYKRTLFSIREPLRIIFNTSLRERTFPQKLKLSLVTPLHKSGDKSNILNYRPISIISPISKILEKIMFVFIQNKVHNLLCTQQHGFTIKKSTLSNLAEYVNFLSSNLANGGQIDAIYTDFAKAFDKVDHKRLLEKLEQFPLNNCIKAWIYSYLTERAQIVCVNGAKSEIIRPTSSVPQGSILAPLLFSLFINDLINDLHCNVLLFADDCKIYQLVKTIDDCFALQRDLKSLSNWCNTNRLNLNVNKCSIISFTRRTDRTFQYFQYRINNSLLSRSKVVKDLGVLFDEKLSFNSHVQSAITRASKLLGFIFRSLKPFNKLQTHITLYNSYVRNILEYGSSIWNPYYHTYTNIVENVQRKFTRILCYKFKINYCDYEERLRKLDMTALFYRRLYFDELLLYKIITGKLNTNLIHSFNIHVPTRVTRFAPIFYVPSVSSNIEFFSLALRLKRQHNEYFSHIDLLDNSLPHTKFLIRSALPSGLWAGFR